MLTRATLCFVGKNTGYKNYDPSHPCRKCWEKHAKPFTGALVYMPWDPASASTSASSNKRQTYQRPLPVFRPPQFSSASSSHHADHHRRIASQPPPTAPMHSPPAHPPPPQHMHSSPPHPPPPHVYSPPPRTQLVGWGSIPPPGAAVMRPGDPRLGGQLCWKCSGRGAVTFLLFEERCDLCNGVGRTFR